MSVCASYIAKQPALATQPTLATQNGTRDEGNIAPGAAVPMRKAAIPITAQSQVCPNNAPATRHERMKAIF